MPTPVDPDLGRWEPYDVATVQDLMSGANVTWWLSGGEALDVFAGRATRAHDDIDISLRRSDLAMFRRHVAGRLDLEIGHDGVLHELTDAPLPDDMHGLWARETSVGPWRLQVNLEPVEAGEWIYRRDARLRLPLDRVIRWRGALPFVNPALQLLWKAKDTRPKDDHDFETIAPLLTADELHWLAEAIARSHPTSPWADRLSGCA